MSCVLRIEVTYICRSHSIAEEKYVIPTFPFFFELTRLFFSKNEFERQWKLNVGQKLICGQNWIVSNTNILISCFFRERDVYDLCLYICARFYMKSKYFTENNPAQVTKNPSLK